jgi:UDP-glucuronate decarboxylase
VAPPRTPLRGEDLTIYGDGSQTRSFCYVDDLVVGIVKLMASADEVTGPINLGNPAECTILALAERVLELTGSRSHIVRRILSEDDPKRRCPDIARLLLDWEPKIAIDEGLKRTIEYFDSIATNHLTGSAS